ncbi:hypothetical protein HW532_15040 [Kaustia mangrovi]|uniref:Uncharacterized protein n=1 Tax=Kaustia mangrovi TaxID=2593653 RepID=A0A7S8HD33_9HYPH|nr:hypothetical protein [Kaustia mangrovi]QPC43888.1 hypothetical protein HW532_15040 [Kaustia mangrovi]
MTRHQFSIAYDGADRSDVHAMDVESLGPALIGFGRLIREANTEFNGDKSRANVHVVSDFEHKCFQINLETIVTYYEQLKGLLGDSEAKTAKDILEWLGIILGTPALTFLGYLRLRRGRPIDESREFVDQNGEGMVSVRFEGEQNHVEVHQHVYQLGENQRALNATKNAVSPLGQDGFDRITLRNGDKVEEVVGADDAEAILASCNIAKSDEKEEDEPEIVTAWLSVYAPVYDEKADKWRFTLGADHVYVDISETTIARDALQRGGALANDTYQVRMEVRRPKEATRKAGKPNYKILEVLRFIPAERPAQQTDMGDQLAPDEQEGQNEGPIEEG